MSVVTLRRVREATEMTTVLSVFFLLRLDQDKQRLPLLFFRASLKRDTSSFTASCSLRNTAVYGYRNDGIIRCSRLNFKADMLAVHYTQVRCKINIAINYLVGEGIHENN